MQSGVPLWLTISVVFGYTKNFQEVYFLKMKKKKKNKKNQPKKVCM